MLNLVRDTFQDNLTFGKFYFNDEFLGDSLELPWKDNAENISCIPEGIYQIRYSEKHRIGELYFYEILDVPNRTYIYIHVANFTSQILGCIAAGIRDNNCVLESKKTLANMFQIVGKENTLTITRVS